MAQLENGSERRRGPAWRRSFFALGAGVGLSALLVPTATPADQTGAAVSLTLDRAVAWARNKDPDRITTVGVLSGPIDIAGKDVSTTTTFKSGGINLSVLAFWNPDECEANPSGRVHCRFSVADAFGRISFRPLLNSTDVAFKLTLKAKDILGRPLEGPLTQNVEIGTDFFSGSLATCVEHRKKLACR